MLGAAPICIYYPEGACIAINNFKYDVTFQRNRAVQAIKMELFIGLNDPLVFTRGVHRPS